MYPRGCDRDSVPAVDERRVGPFIDFASIRRGFDDQLAGADCDWAFSRAQATEPGEPARQGTRRNVVAALK